MYYSKKMDKIPNINIINNESLPGNRKEIIIMWIRAIKDAKTLDDRIQAEKNFINAAVPEIPAKEYPRDRIYLLEPSYWDEEKDFLRNTDFIFPEQIMAWRGYIEMLRKQRWLRILQKEHAAIEDLLKIHKNWYFDDSRGLTLGK